MRKLFVLLLAFVMIASLPACGTNEIKPAETPEIYEEKAPETTESTEAVEPTETTETPEKAEIPEATEPEEENIFTIIEAKDCFYDAGFVELIAGTAESSEYTFTAENSDAVEWSVYVLDEAFDEGFRYIKQVAEPVLVGDGTIFIDEGQYVYVYCSANEFTTGVADETAKLNVTVK